MIKDIIASTFSDVYIEHCIQFYYFYFSWDFSVPKWYFGPFPLLTHEKGGGGAGTARPPTMIVSYITSIIMQFREKLTSKFCELSTDAVINRFDRTTETTTTTSHIFTVFFDWNNKQLFLFSAPCAGNLFPLNSNVDWCFLDSLQYQKLGGTLHIVSPLLKSWGGQVHPSDTHGSLQW